MARRQRKALADMRALEEEAERVNPLDGRGKHTLVDHLKQPMKGFGDYMEEYSGGIRSGRYEGMGATPSMGLSQFRGGMAVGQVVGGAKAKPALMMCDDPPMTYSDKHGRYTSKDKVTERKSKAAIRRLDKKLSGQDLSHIRLDRLEGEGRIQVCSPPPMAHSDAHGTYVRKAKRAPAGPDDGRRKRAAIVRQVMDERGVSMIEASKIVKAEGLYNP